MQIIADQKQSLKGQMAECRKHTLALLKLVPDEFLRRRVHSFYSPIGWHFGHVGRTEEYWVVGEALKRPLLDDRLTFLFADLKDNPKDNRVNIPDRAGIVDYLGRTRDRVLEALDAVELDPRDPFLADGYAWQFAIQHEYQHQETIYEMLHLIQKELVSGSVRDLQSAVCNIEPSDRTWVDLPGGAFTMGSAEPSFYDNEKCPHSVRVEAFRMRKTPVSAAEWMEFMADGGYARPELWCEEGWEWRSSENAIAPEYWVSRDGEWAAIGVDGIRKIEPDEPASCLSWYEADAFARWSGKRLPTEAEWEYARGLELGLKGMAGSIWQWTSSRFLPYPGFSAFPYEGYSWDHMKGGHFVCRGGSWATSLPIRRATFRNWYVPSYRQGFLGMRLAEDL